MHSSRWAIFFGAAACTAALFQTSDVEARYRVLPQASCALVIANGTETEYLCGVPTGSEFSAATVNLVEIDVSSDNWSNALVEANVMWQSWTGYYAAIGGNTAKSSGSGSGVQHLYPDSNLFRVGSIYDYRWVLITMSPGVSLYGTYVTNTDP
jgi:hypothetical protein